MAYMDNGYGVTIVGFDCDDCCETPTSAMTEKEREAFEHGKDVCQEITELMRTALVESEEKGRFPKPSFKKGVGSEVHATYDEYVNRVRGKARVNTLCDMLGTLAVDTYREGIEACDLISSLPDCPRGSITATFKDEKFTTRVADAMTTLALAFGQLTALNEEVTKKMENL